MAYGNKEMPITVSRRDDNEIKRICDTIREISYQIHEYFGTGFLEKVYENVLKHRLERLGLRVESQVGMEVHDVDGFGVGRYEADLIVEGKIIIELKVVKTLCTVHEVQLINYLKTTGIQDGMLINFGSEKFEVLKRVVEANSYRPHFLREEESDEQI